MSSNRCIHCGLCTKNCLFLQKYKTDVGQIVNHPELAYHCFLCGRCTQVCPVGVDGRELLLGMRKEQVKQNGNNLAEKGYGMLLWEKNDYKFANYKSGKKKSVLFPGCNFPSFYPRATRKIVSLLKEKADIGVVFDCCGKPLAELGLPEKELLQTLEQRLHRAGVEELVMLCPNCYHFLKPKLGIPVISIYEKMKELGLGREIPSPLLIFPPCPDRGNWEILGHLRHLLREEPTVLHQVQCCGLGGCASGKEKEIAAQMGRQAAEICQQRGEKLTTYCASCAGNFVRNGYKDTEHLLLMLLGIKEQPRINTSVINRAKMKYWRG